MAKPDLSVYGGRLLHHGYAGMVADMQDSDLDSMVNESTTPIDFGVAVAYGSLEMGCKPVTSDTDRIVGISSRFAIGPANPSGDVLYNRRDALPVCRRGNIYAIAAENTAVGDRVLALTASGGALGSTTGGAAGAGRVAIPGAVWQTATTAGNVGKIRIASGAESQFVTLPGSLIAGQSYLNNAGISVGANSGVGSGHLQQEANGTVVAVRLCIASKVLASGTTPTFQAVVATSDTAGSSVDTIWSPNVNGVAYKALADAQGRGWVPVTFNGGQSTIKMPAAVGSNATSYNAIIRSDRIPLPSRPRKAGETGGPMFLARIENVDAAAQYTSMGGVSFAEYLAQFGNAGIDVFRVARTNNGAVSDLTLQPADIISGYGHPFWFEFEYDTRHIAFLIGGDSRYGGGGHPEMAWIPWMQKPMRAASLGLPVNLYNLAGSSHSSASYIALINNYLDAGGRGTHCLIPCHTPNDGLNSTAGADVVLANLRALIDRLNSLGIKVILSTGYACGYNGQSEIARQYCITWAKAQTDVILFDTDAIISDTTTTPGTGVIKAAYVFSGDNIHCNVDGNAALSAALLPIVAANL